MIVSKVHLYINSISKSLPDGQFLHFIPVSEISQTPPFRHGLAASQTLSPSLQSSPAKPRLQLKHTQYICHFLLYIYISSNQYSYCTLKSNRLGIWLFCLALHVISNFLKFLYHIVSETILKNWHLLTRLLHLLCTVSGIKYNNKSPPMCV